MIKYIKGCLIKYNQPFPNGAYISYGSFDETKMTRLPVTPNFSDHTNIIGYCDLEYRKDGIFYTFYPESTEIAKEVLSKWDTDFYIGVYCRKVICAEDSFQHVINAELVSGSIALGHYPSAFVDQVVFDLGGEC